MGEQDNVQLVMQAYKNFQNDDIQAVLDVCADDIEWELAKMDNVPFAGKRRGKDQVAQFFSVLNESQQVLQFEPKEFVAQGDKVVALGHYAWSVRSTDRTFESDWAEVFTIQGRKIVRFREYADTAATVVAYSKS